MPRRRIVALAMALLVSAASLVLVLNREPTRAGGRTPAPSSPPIQPSAPTAAPEVRRPVAGGAVPKDEGTPAPESPIGRDALRNHLRIGAAWLPPLRIVGAPAPSSGEIHLLAHIHAAEGSPHGFAKGEWIPYLSIHYRIEPTKGGPAIEGSLVPLAAGDGPYYGTNLRLPGPAPHRLVLRIEPPARNGLGRVEDPLAGVAPWWEPFEVSFDW